MKRCSTSLIIKEIQRPKPQWEITSHLLEWPSSKRTQVTSVSRDVEKGEPTYTVSAHVYWHSRRVRQNEPSQKLEAELAAYDLAIPAGQIPGKNKNTNLKRHMHPSVHSNCLQLPR